MKKRILVLSFLPLVALAVRAQNVGGIWLSVSGAASEGNGVHNGEMQVLSIQDSVENLTAASGGAATGKLVLGSFAFKKTVNSNSVFFFSSVGKGTVLPNLAFRFYDRKLDGSFTPSLTITLFDAIVVKYKITSTENNNSLQACEEVSLLYNRIQLTDSAGNSTIIQNGAR